MVTPAKTRRIELRISEDERRTEEAAAAALGISLSEFVRQAARDRAVEALRERGEIAISHHAAVQLLAALDADAPPSPAMRELFDRPTPWQS